MTWKQKIRRALNRFGYDIVPYQRGADTSADMPCPPYSYRTFAPWFSKEFQALYKNVANNTVVKEDRCYMIHHS